MALTGVLRFGCGKNYFEVAFTSWVTAYIRFLREPVNRTPIALWKVWIDQRINSQSCHEIKGAISSLVIAVQERRKQPRPS